MIDRRRPDPRPAWLLISTAALTACQNEVPTTMLPDPPAPLSQPAEYAFGDRIAAADERLAARVADALGQKYGRPREARYVAPAVADLVTLQRFYAARARKGGWIETSAVAAALRPGEGGFGFTQGDRALAIIWLESEKGGATPVTVMRFGPQG